MEISKKKKRVILTRDDVCSLIHEYNDVDKQCCQSFILYAEVVDDERKTVEQKITSYEMPNIVFDNDYLYEKFGPNKWIRKGLAKGMNKREKKRLLAILA